MARVMKEVAAIWATPPPSPAPPMWTPDRGRLREGRTVARALTRLGAEAEFGQLATRGDVERAVISLLRRS
nr:hypothetical protein GCM10020093_025450 [Planobispora longispora]